MNLLGIDYGRKRVGLAYADTELGVAVPIGAAVGATLESRMERIAEEVRARRIDKIVVGYPFNMDGSVGATAREVDGFIDCLRARFSLPVERCDERLSSFQAECDLRALNPRAAGKTTAARKRYRRSGDIDSRAIALVLQDYIDGGMKSDPRGENFGA